MTQPIAPRLRSPMAGRQICADAGQHDVLRLPTVIASDATTKNQPPDIDIIMFQMRPGIENGTSSFQKRCHVREMKTARDFVQIARHRAQRLIEAERHVPRLARENRKDRGALGADHAARKEREKERDGKRDVAEHRHRLQDVEDRHRAPVRRAPALRRRACRRRA